MSSLSLASSIISSQDKHDSLYDGIQPYYHDNGDYSDVASLSTRSEYFVNKYAEKIERKGHHILKMNVFDKELGRRCVKVSVFETFPITGKYIMNAVTGIPYTKDDNLFYRCGSSDEDDLFKIKDVSKGRNGIILFYDSPEQYERHMHVTLNKETKEKWHLRNIPRQ